MIIAADNTLQSRTTVTVAELLARKYASAVSAKLGRSFRDNRTVESSPSKLQAKENPNQNQQDDGGVPWGRSGVNGRTASLLGLK